MFISTMSGSQRKDEGLCLQCASELNLPQMKEFLNKWGVNEDDVKGVLDEVFDENGQLNPDAFSSLIGTNDEDGELGDMSDITDGDSENNDSEDDNLFERGGAGTMPNFLKNLFGGSDNSKKNETEDEKKSKKKQEKTDKKRKCLEMRPSIW